MNLKDPKDLLEPWNTLLGVVIALLTFGCKSCGSPPSNHVLDHYLSRTRVIAQYASRTLGRRFHQVAGAERGLFDF